MFYWVNRNTKSTISSQTSKERRSQGGRRITKKSTTKQPHTHILYTDSKSAINAIDKHTIKSIIVKQCIDNLNELGRTTEVTINWIPGYQNYDGNEITDLLANCGNEKFIEPNIFPIPIRHITRKIKKLLPTINRNSTWTNTYHVVVSQNTSRITC